MSLPHVVDRPAPPPAAVVARSAPPLTPRQARALDAAAAKASACDVLCLAGPPGVGKSLIMRRLAERLGGTLLTAAHAMRRFNEAAPDHLEEALTGLVRAAFKDHDVVLFDDWMSIYEVGTYGAARPFILTFAFRTLVTEAARRGKTFIYSHGYGHRNWLVGGVGVWIDVEPFDTADKQAVLEHYWGRPIDSAHIASLELAYNQLSGYQLEAAAKLLRDHHDGPLDAPALIAAVDRVANRSNLILEEVEDVSLRGLVGVEAQMEILERTVLLPVLEPELARSLGLKAARGVLLHGSPGTGKTSIGRLLAHRMKGKFFLFDGTLIADDMYFHDQVRGLLDAAAASAPSVVFIDDADVIFRGGKASGFVRQLLSELDGLARNGNKSVCLVMTAMDIADMPPALIRSGRVEVWLEMKPPTLEQRAEILETWVRMIPDAPPFDALEAAAACEGFTPADMRGLIGDARAMAAYDLVRKAPARPFGQYLEAAAAEISARKRILAALQPNA